jgi:uncharacterized Zn-binding protein involved in type VI secretion
MKASATQQVDDRRLARMGDPVWCPVCEEVGYIAQGNPTYIDEYIAVATNGHAVRCNCEPGSHQLIATQQSHAADMDATIDIPPELALQAKANADKITLKINAGLPPSELLPAHNS